MLLEMIKQFNWLDILIIIILFRIGYIATKIGIPVEFFKFLATIVALYLSLHYYTNLSDWLVQRVPNFLSFLFLAIVGYLILVPPRMVFSRFIKMEATPNLNKWGGLVLGIARGFLLVSLVTFTLVISGSGYLKKSVTNSYLARRVFNVAPKTYAWLWKAIVSKFMSGEKLNEAIPSL
jgi:uncharacterized membrane protein required for colicin V production